MAGLLDNVFVRRYVCCRCPRAYNTSHERALHEAIWGHKWLSR